MGCHSELVRLQAIVRAPLLLPLPSIINTITRLNTTINSRGVVGEFGGSPRNLLSSGAGWRRSLDESRTQKHREECLQLCREMSVNQSDTPDSIVDGTSAYNYTSRIAGSLRKL